MAEVMRKNEIVKKAFHTKKAVVTIQTEVRPARKKENFYEVNTFMTFANKFENENKVDWDNKIMIKIGLNDYEKLLAIHKGYDKNNPDRNKIFHSQDGKPSKMIMINEANDKNGNHIGYYFNVTVTSPDGNKYKVNSYLSLAQFEIIMQHLNTAFNLLV